MKEITKILNIYKFDELSQVVQAKIKKDYAGFLLRTASNAVIRAYVEAYPPLASLAFNDIIGYLKGLDNYGLYRLVIAAYFTVFSIIDTIDSGSFEGDMFLEDGSFYSLG